MDRALTPEMLDSSPIKQFTHWFDEAVAAGLPEPNAMVLTTIGVADGPHARTVLLKGHDNAGFTFYTNRTSRKRRTSRPIRGAARCSPGTALAAR